MSRCTCYSYVLRPRGVPKTFKEFSPKCPTTEHRRKART